MYPRAQTKGKGEYIAGDHCAKVSPVNVSRSSIVVPLKQPSPQLVASCNMQYRPLTPLFPILKRLKNPKKAIFVPSDLCFVKND